MCLLFCKPYFHYAPYMSQFEANVKDTISANKINEFWFFFLQRTINRQYLTESNMIKKKTPNTTTNNITDFLQGYCTITRTYFKGTNAKFSKNGV